MIKDDNIIAANKDNYIKIILIAADKDKQEKIIVVTKRFGLLDPSLGDNDSIR